MEASDVSVESRASDLNFFSGICSVVWWVGAQYFLSEDTKTKGQRTMLEAGHTLRRGYQVSLAACFSCTLRLDIHTLQRDGGEVQADSGRGRTPPHLQESRCLK